jgi:predicted DNA-binding protein YlxM (UPF0122 family)
MSEIKNNSKLSDELIHKIREYYNKGYSCQKTAIKFGVGKTTVRKYVDIRPRKVLTDEQRKVNAVKAVNKRRRKIKEMAIAYKGGVCQECGYDKCNSALEFHHLDPNEKDFNISKNGHSRSWKRVKDELDKCILVCSNCHKEIHAGLIEV